MYQKKTEGWIKHYDFALLDILCLQIAFVISYVLSGNGFYPYQKLLYRSMAVFLILEDMIVLFLFETLKSVLKKGYYQNFLVTIRHVLIVGALAVFYLFLMQRGQYYSRLAFVFNFIIYFIVTYFVREFWKNKLRKKMMNGGETSLLIITTSDLAQEVISNVKKNNYARYTLAGIALLNHDWTYYKIDGVPIVADSQTVPMYICQEWIDEVLMVTSDNIYPEEMVNKLLQTGVTLHVNLTRIGMKKRRKQFVEKIGNYTVLTTSINYASSMQLFFKRIMDILIGIVGCILTGVIFLLVGPIIYMNSPGPIFFSQERVGKNGKKFKMYKFRSMVMNAEEQKENLMKYNKMRDGRMFKLDFDPRIIGNKILEDGSVKTGIGDFIRRRSLDEFPQFFNVLKGDMSVVGTRPPLPDEVSLYDLHHRTRLSIKLGITGMWQVQGRSDITDFEEVVRLDREYIENWNIGLDIKILLKTIEVVLKKNGSI